MGYSSPVKIQSANGTQDSGAHWADYSLIAEQRLPYLICGHFGMLHLYRQPVAWGLLGAVVGVAIQSAYHYNKSCVCILHSQAPSN